MTGAGGADPALGGLLAVHAHPDDETLSTGALLAHWARRGPVTVVTATRGERGEVIPPELAHLEGDGPALARQRVGELRTALAALGVPDHVFLDEVVPSATGEPASAPVRYADSGMVWAPGEREGARAQALAALPPDAFVGAPVAEAARRLAAVVLDRRPAVVVTYEPGGGYGHPDHVHVHRVTEHALALADAAGWRVPLLLWSVQAESLARASRAALPGVPGVDALLSADPRLRLADPREPMPSMVVPDAEVDVVVDVAAVRDRIRAALLAYPTQVTAVLVPDRTHADGVLGVFALSHRVLAALPDAEQYRAAPDRDGWDGPGLAAAPWSHATGR